ncbi:MAG TPA: PRC-barrel domain-containing protein [Solirubrobacteraceae bacterium]|jgi:sporulation protein YlmC with PRC-barrel domain|nr:PRC-barrel domain-containing protein [Solirubrobacteraceae bacterium]
MSERFTAATGRKLVSRASAEALGTLSHLVIDVPKRQVTSLVMGKGRKARLVDWDEVSGFGPDAIMIADESALHEPRDDHESAAGGGKLELVGKRVLSDMGNELGAVTDVVFDPASGAIETLVIGEQEVAASSILGVGSYAAVVKAPRD